MTNTPNREKIQQALAEATPGPWETSGSDIRKVGFYSHANVICQMWDVHEEDYLNAEANAHLIANAPEWLRYLLNQLDILQDACDGHEMSAKDAMAERDDLQAQLEAKDTEIAKLNDDGFKLARAAYNNVNRLMEQRSAANEKVEARILRIDELEEESTRLREDNKAMAEVLALYADEDIWREDAEGFVDFSIAESDAGESARICLSSLKEAAI